MLISLQLSKDFENSLEDLKKEFGEDFEYINGVHASQLDFSEFLNNFVSKDTMADATIDPNANANHKDIRSFMTEKAKSEDKLFGLNKIFLEIKKMWGLKTAKQWLRQEFSKGFYLNDAASASYYPYCYHKSEIITVRYNDKVNIVSFEQLYDLVTEEEEILNIHDNAFAKYPANLFVLDVVNDKQVFTKVSRVVKHNKNNKLKHVKLANGLDQIVTEDHKMITTQGEKSSKELIPFEDSLTTVNIDYNNLINNDIYEIFIADNLQNIKNDLYIDETKISESNKFNDGVITYVKNHNVKYASKLNSRKKGQPQLRNKLPLTKELGYIIGLLITDGTYSQQIVGFSQKAGKIFDRFIECCNKSNIPVRIKSSTEISVGNTLFTELLTSCFLKKAKSDFKELKPEVFNYNKEFLRGLLSGIIDGDGAVPKAWNNMCGYYGNSRTLRNQVAQLCMIFGFKPRCQIRSYKKGFGGKNLNTIKHMFGVDFRIFKESEKLWSLKIEDICSNFITEQRSDAAIRYPYSTGYGDKEVIICEDFESNDLTVFDITTDTHHFICNNILSHNCWANDFTKLANEGLFFLNDYNNKSPKHLTTYFDDVIEFVSFLSNRQSGAVGMPNLLIWAYYFWKKDVENNYYLKDPDTYLRQEFQKIIYRLNQPFLRIDQCAFTNVSIFDRKYIEALFGGVIFPDGTCAIDCIEDIIKVQKIFMEVVKETRNEQMFTFPILTFSLLFTEGKFQDEDFARWASKHNMTWSDSNFFISDNVGILSNCCRLLSDTTKLEGFVNSIGGTALSIGSCRVSTINLVRIAYEALGYAATKKNLDPTSEKAKDNYLSILRERTLLNCKALASMRYILKRNIEKGLLPNYRDGAVELDKQYCTVGILGMYEVMELYGLITTDEFGNKSYKDEGIEFASKIFAVINDVKDNFECDFTFNIEAIPAENCAGVICTADNLIFEQNKYFIYSNQWIPLMEKCTIQEKCRVSSILDNKCSGGAIAHINIESRFATEEQAWEMLNYVANSGVIYSAFTTKINICKRRHAFIGTTTCPHCGEPMTDQYSRVVGFYAPTSSYQKIRKREFNVRKWYDVLKKPEIM